jgi:hypothetical protein
MRNYLTSQGLLQDGEDQRSLLVAGAQDRDTQIESMVPFTPVDTREAEYMRRTMIPAGVNDKGVQQFTTPERAIYQKNKLMIQGLEEKATEDFQRKVKNPFFKAGDFITDVARNTIGAIPNFFTGGQAFPSDPSKDAVTSYKTRLQDLSDLQTMNLKYFVDGRTTRATAFTDALQSKASGTAKLNSRGEYVQMYQDGTSAKILDSQGNPVTALDDSKITLINGLPHRWDRISEQFVAVGDPEEFMRQKTEIREQELFVESKGVFDDERSSLNAAIMSGERDVGFINRKVDEITNLLLQEQANGWNGLMAALPENSARALKEAIATLQANVAFATLQEMRNNSKTGGALGNVSDTEIKLLYSKLGSLDNLNDAKQLLTTFREIKYNANEALHGVKRKFFSERNRFYPTADGDGQRQFDLVRDDFMTQGQTQDNSADTSQTENDDDALLKQFDTMFGFEEAH